MMQLQLILERSSLVLSIEADCRLGTAFGGGGVQILLVALSWSAIEGWIQSGAGQTID
jgi:hypothetical protein